LVVRRGQQTPYSEQPFISGDDAACVPGEIDESLQIVNDAGNDQVDDRFPNDVVSKRLIRKPVIAGSMSAISTALPRIKEPTAIDAVDKGSKCELWSSIRG